MGMGWDKWTIKGQEETFYSDGYAHFLDGGDGFTSVKLTKLYSLFIYSSLNF